jgi:hypothetical protein
MNAIAQRDFIPGLGGITLAFTLAPSCAASPTAACFRWFRRVGRQGDHGHSSHGA